SGDLEHHHHDHVRLAQPRIPGADGRSARLIAGDDIEQPQSPGGPSSGAAARRRPVVRACGRHRRPRSHTPRTSRSQTRPVTDARRPIEHAMALLVDADGHVLEPPDLWSRYVERPWRERAIRVRRGADGRDVLDIDGRPARLTTSEMLGGLGGMGRSLDELATAALSGRYAENVPP